MLRHTLWILLISLSVALAAEEQSSDSSQQTATDASAQSVSGNTQRLRPRKRTQLPDASPNVWFIDVASALHYCYGDSDNVYLWRADASSATWLSIRTDTSTIRLPWPKQEHTVAWPVTLPPQDGGEYMVSVDNWLETVITFHGVPDILGTEVQRIEWMQTQQCHSQAEILSQASPVTP